MYSYFFCIAMRYNKTETVVISHYWKLLPLSWRNITLHLRRRTMFQCFPNKDSLRLREATNREPNKEVRFHNSEVKEPRKLREVTKSKS